MSIAVDGSTITDHGTSFSTPLVAQILATLDHRIAGETPREVLLALMYHFAKVPPILDNDELRAVSRDFVGFGVPVATDEMLLSDDHSITLVFAGTLPERQEIAFNFQWPPSLTKDGKCRGHAALTLVYSPPIDSNHKAEFARVNLDAYLRQESIDEDGEVSWDGRLKNEYKPLLEQKLIDQGMKWWPVKRYEKTLTRLGASANWRLVVDSLCRAAFNFPTDGVQFCAVLTISDPKGEAPVFGEVRQALINLGVELADIRTAVTARVR